MSCNAVLEIHNAIMGPGLAYNGTASDRFFGNDYLNVYS